MAGVESRDEALRALVEREGPRLYALGLRFCGSPHEAQDLVQETFLQATRAWDAFEGRSKPSTWLYTIAARVCQRFHRKRSGEPERLASLEELLPLGAGPMGVVPADEDPLAHALRAEARERLEQAIARLPTPFRMPLVLHAVVGFSVEEVAAVLGLVPATVKTRLHRARLAVRAALEGALPRRAVPAPIFSRRVCLDLLEAKQEALDRGSAFAFPDEVVCERCAELFATLDLTQAACRELARGPLPAELRERLLALVAGGEARRAPGPLRPG